MTIVLTDADVSRCLTMKDAMQAVDAVLQERHRQTAAAGRRTQLRLARPSRTPEEGPGVGLECAPCGLARVEVAGIVAQAVDGRAVGGQAVGGQALVALWSATSGALLALVAGQRLLHLAAGATVGVAADVMARTDADEVGVLGCGALAMTLLAGVQAVRPLRRVRVWGAEGADCTRAADRWARELHVPVEPVPSTRQAVHEAGVVIAATGAATPVVAVEWLRPGTHVTCATPLYRGHTELGSDVIEMADILACDYPEHPAGEATYLLQGTPHSGRIADLAALAAAPPRRSRGAITLFLFAGLPHVALELARQAYRRGAAQGLGLPLGEL